MRHARWFALASILVLVLVAACGRAPTRNERLSAPGDNTVNVVIDHFQFALDAPVVNAGAVTFAVTNEDDTPHDFRISGNGTNAKTTMLRPGQTDTLTVDLKPGTYDYICTVPGHSLGGMKGTFTVQ